MEDIFFGILRSGIGSAVPEVRRLSESEWNGIYELAVRHSLLGITFAGIQNHIGL